MKLCTVEMHNAILGNDLKPVSKGAVKGKPCSQDWLIAAGAYQGFCSMIDEAARSISTSPGQDASLSQVTPPQFVRLSQQLPVPIYTPGWRKAL